MLKRRLATATDVLSNYVGDGPRGQAERFRHTESRTRVLVEQLGAVDHSRLGGSAGTLARQELQDVDWALETVIGLTR